MAYVILNKEAKHFLQNEGWRPFELVPLLVLNEPGVPSHCYKRRKGNKRTTSTGEETKWHYL